MVDQIVFQMFDMSIRSGDICDQSRKLSEIAPTFFGPPKFFGAGLPKVIRALSTLPRITWSEDTPTSPEVIEAHVEF